MTRIYKYQVTQYPTNVDMEEWADHAEALWGDRDKPFFLPDQEKVFRSRSSAQERVHIVQRWGGDAEVLEASPEWTEVGEAARRRKRERDLARAEKLRKQASELEQAHSVSLSESLQLVRSSFDLKPLEFRSLSDDSSGGDPA